jgi:replicative DNA helicase
MAAKNTDHLRVPPHNIEAEQSVLGSLMLDKDAVIKVADIVSPERFLQRRAQHHLRDDARPLRRARTDRRPVACQQARRKRQARRRRRVRIPRVARKYRPVRFANVAHYANSRPEKGAAPAAHRRGIGNRRDMGFDEEKDVEKVLDAAEQRLFGVSQKYLKQDFVPIRSILEDAFNRIDELHKSDKAFRGVPTGFADLDNMLSGLQNSDLIILAARPSVGKTSFALDIARQIGVQAKVPVGLFSLEMSSDQLVDRMIAAQAGVDLWRLRTGKLQTEGDDNDFQKIGEAIGILSEAPIFIDDTSSANIMEMRTMARRLQSEHKLGLIIIDYLQLMEGRSRGGDNRVQEISEISRGLKQLAKELNVPVIALSQLSRAVESRPDQIPKLSDLRESGSIEQDADVVMFLYREDRVKPDTPNKGIADVIIAKHRNGPVGKVSLFFEENSTTFKNLERVHSENE